MSAATPRQMRRRVPVTLSGPGAARIAEIAGSVPDPELPMVSLANLGILRSVDVEPGTGAVTVTITPTYSGCPAMDTMSTDIVAALRGAGYEPVTVRKVLGGDWSSRDVTADGRAAMRAGGIAPPAHGPDAHVTCPLCSSPDTEQLAPFGSTSCKALYRCRSCLEPFEYFKVHE